MHYANQHILELLYTYSYLILFPLVVIEGPIVTVIAGFLVSIDFLNPILAYLIIITGDLAGDFLYYSAGRWWLNSTAYKLFKFVGIDVSKINKLKLAIKNHRGKVLFFGKLSHAIGGPILVAAGIAKIPIRDFFLFNFWATLPKSLLLMLVGFYFGSALGSINKYLNLSLIALVALSAIIVLIYHAIATIATKTLEKIDK